MAAGPGTRAPSGPPAPPSDLARKKPLFVELPKAALIHRIFHTSREPRHFDRGPNGRFNSPDGSYGVMYGAENPAGAVAETFLRNPGADLIAADILAQRGYARFEVKRAVLLVALAGAGLARVGATAEVCHASTDYRVPQAWSAALKSAFPHAHGIAYTARHDDSEFCYALFDGAATRFGERDRTVPLDLGWFEAIAVRYGLGISP